MGPYRNRSTCSSGYGDHHHSKHLLSLSSSRSTARRFTILTFASCLLGICCMVMLSTCGSDNRGDQSDPVRIVFAPNTSYQKALKFVTDEGLELELPCHESSFASANGQSGQWEIWASPDQEDNFDTQAPSMWVGPSPLASSDWISKLQSASIVDQVDVSGNIVCPAYFPDKTPRPGVPYYIPESQAGTYAHVVFSSSSTYDEALRSITKFGLRLANPCYEQQKNTDSTPSNGHTAGQETSFAASRMLTVASTLFTSTLWQQQLQGSPSVQRIDMMVSNKC